jgi:hypothetical protein
MAKPKVSILKMGLENFQYFVVKFMQFGWWQARSRKFFGFHSSPYSWVNRSRREPKCMIAMK